MRIMPCVVLTSATNPLLRTTIFAYDVVGRITQQVLLGARTIVYIHDRNGNLISLTPPGKPAHSFGYTVVDVTARYKPPLLNGDSTVTRYFYDLDRRIRHTIRPDSIAVSVFYDTLGCGSCGSASRPKTIIFDRGTLNFSYDPTTGLLDSLSAPGGNALTYTYDGSLPKKATWTGEVQGSVEVTYDNNFRVTSQKVNGGNDVSFQYDRDGLLTAAGALAITRDPQNGRITSTTLGSVTTGQAYNNFGELKSFQAVFASDTLFKTVYAQDSLGRITQITETIQGQTRKFNYLYDTAGRLTDMSRNDTLLAVYEYDANGNRLNLTTPSETRSGTYDAQDRLLTYGNASYSYTRNGELLTKVVGTDTTRYTFDAFGNLVSVRLPDSTLIEYVIDGQNRRVGKKVDSVLVKRWLYGNKLNIVAELDGAGNVVSRFVYVTKGYAPDYVVKGGVTYRIVTDHLGSVRLVVNTTTGQVVQRIDYDEFGSVMYDSNSGFQPFGFAGGLYDEHIMLTRFGARDYDAMIGRWRAKDPVGFAGGDVNLYEYVFNDPANLIDPIGLKIYGPIARWALRNWLTSAAGAGQMFFAWITGTGLEIQTFDERSIQVQNMMNAPGIDKAREAFYKKNAGRFNESCSVEPLEPLTDYRAGFGLKGLLQAGLDPAEQFVGNYEIDIYPNPDNTITITLTNTTSMTSFLYGIGPSWRRSKFRPGGNMFQIYTWTEPIRK